MQLEVLVACANGLGESVFWSASSRHVYWIDGVALEVHRWQCESQEHEVFQAGAGAIGMIAPTTDPGTLAMSDRDGFSLLALERGRKLVQAHPEKGREAIGYNDGKVDPSGRLWIGTYDASEVEPRGTLWMFANGETPTLVESGMAVVNGPAFSPDGRVMYLSDSIARRILAFDLADGVLSSRRVLVQCTPDEGLPDGLTVDVEGCVWCAHWDGGRVTRFSPTGERLALIPFPVPRVTSVAFGGEDLSTLFVTTARYGLSSAQIQQSPHAGALFSVRPGVAGVPPTLLRLPFKCRT